MWRPYEERLPDDLHGIASRLRQERAEIDDLRLDHLKQRVLARFSTSNGKRGLIRSRLAAIGATVAVLAGSGGALAIARLDSHPNTHGGAASDQYSSSKQRGKLPRKAACAPKRNAKGHGKTQSKQHGKHYAKGHSKRHASCPRRRATRKHHRKSG